MYLLFLLVTLAATDAVGDLLNCERAANRLGVTDRWVRRAVYERRIPFVKIGRLVRFRPEDLDRYVAENLVQPPGDAA